VRINHFLGEGTDVAKQGIAAGDDNSYVYNALVGHCHLPPDRFLLNCTKRCVVSISSSLVRLDKNKKQISYTCPHRNGIGQMELLSSGIL